MGESLTLWTIRIALALYAWVLIGLLTQRVDERSPLRYVWAVSVGFFLIHVALAFHFYHDWSHARAVEHTASETQRLMGVRFGYGIYFNHLFAVVWLWDAIHWLQHPQRYKSGSSSLHLLVHSYLFFIAFNGAVIFEDGPVRWAGIFGTIVIGALAMRRWLAARRLALPQATADTPDLHGGRLPGTPVDPS